MHYQTLVSKKADSVVFGNSVARAVRALALERTMFRLHYRKEKRQTQALKISEMSEILVVYTDQSLFYFITET